MFTIMQKHSQSCMQVGARCNKCQAYTKLTCTVDHMICKNADGMGNLIVEF